MKGTIEDWILEPPLVQTAPVVGLHAKLRGSLSLRITGTLFQIQK